MKAAMLDRSFCHLTLLLIILYELLCCSHVQFSQDCATDGTHTCSPERVLEQLNEVLAVHRRCNKRCHALLQLLSMSLQSITVNWI